MINNTKRLINVDQSEYKKGILYTLGCYFIWGNFPLYWYSLKMLGSTQLMSQRIIWSVVFVVLLLTLYKEWRSILNILMQRKTVLILFITSQLLFFNWMAYLWAITANRIVDASLGYFLTPLLSIFLGRLVLKERLSHLQTLAVSIAVVGIIWLTIEGRTIPYVALILASTFSVYGLLKKTHPVKTLPNIAFETFFMLPFALIYLTYAYQSGELIFTALPTISLILLLLSGAMTTVPLLLFSEGAKKIPLSLIGIIQFISPTLQMFNGVVFFGEQVSFMRLIGFIIVWIAVIIFIMSEYKRYQAQIRLLALANKD